MSKLFFCALVGLIFCLVSQAFSQDIILWDRDFDQLFEDPEGAGMVDATYGIEKALIENGCSFTTVASLPANLDPYDTLIVVMGTYC